MPEGNDPNAPIIEEFRTNGGKVGGFFEGATLLLLNTRGVKTGLPRTVPLDCLPDGDRFVVFGTKSGAPTEPYWVRNVLADQNPTIEFETRTILVRAVQIPDPEREELYARQVERRPAFAGYVEKTKGIRTIPVVVFERRDM
jgi:deazaflavin-dependent oxidoreductase (nitroreductase family)